MNFNQPFLSVIVLAYNSEKWIKRCIDSILSQDYDNYELIVIDDGSTDNTLDILGKYQIKGVKVLHQENMGIAKSRNRGITLASGKYVWVIDGDDCIEEDSLDGIEYYIRDNDIDILRFNYRAIKNGVEIPFYYPYPSNTYQGENLKRLKHGLIYHAYEQLFPHWIQVYKKDLVSHIPFHSEKEVYGDDIVFNCIVYQKAKKVKVISDIFYDYYQRDDSFSKNNQPIIQEMMNSYFVLKDHYNNLGIFKEYKDDLLHNFIDYMLFISSKKEHGAIVREYARNENQEEARNLVKKVLSSDSMKQIINDSEDRKLNDDLKELYEILKNEDEVALYHYLGKKSEN